MTKAEMSNLKTLISTFCRNEINHNRCDEGECDYCPMNFAYEKVQDTEADDEEDEEE